MRQSIGLLEGAGGAFLSLDRITLPASSAWGTAAFDLGADALAGAGDPAMSLASVSRLRIVHAPDLGGAVPVSGVLGVDDIPAVREPGTAVLVAWGLVAAGVGRPRPRR